MRKVFDTEDWRTLIGLQGITQQKAAVDLYASQLMKKAREQGKRLYVFPINVAYEDRPGDIYHLVHVSQHPKARLVMEDAVTRVKGTSVEEQLFIAPEVEGYAVEALRNSKVRRMTALDLAGEVWQKSLYASWRTDHRWSEPLTEARLRYASDDVEHLETLYHDLLSKVEEDGMMEAYEVVRSVYPVYMRQQARGVPFDAELYERMRARLKEKLEVLDTQLREHAPDHPDEGGRWVWRNNRKPEEREGRNGALRALALAGTPLKDRKKSTRLAYLKKYENAPFLEALDQYLRHADLEGNTRGWMDLYHEDGRLYPNVMFFSQVTGRSAYADPALQNIAKSLDLQGMEGTSFRDCIRAPEGSSIVKADYSAQELRILAHVAGDEDLLNAFVAQAAGGKDPHLVLGEKIAGKELKKGTPEGRTYRQAGKRANYGFSYGAGWKRYQRTVYEDTAEVITDLQAKQEKWAFEEAWGCHLAAGLRGSGRPRARGVVYPNLP